MFMSLDSSTLRCRYSDEEIQEAIVCEGRSALKFRKRPSNCHLLTPSILLTGAPLVHGATDGAVCVFFPADDCSQGTKAFEECCHVLRAPARAPSDKSQSRKT